ncbi:ammonium transporter [Williamsia sp.]|uniref:ammonium transporter n=1 Tax=Williamsia sp. TaxID=1872085 RepID=UPI002F91C568
MKRRNGLIALCAAAVTAAGFITAIPANAAPTPTDISYEAEIVDNSKIVFTTDIGSLRTNDDELEIVDSAGNVAATVPLFFNLDDLQFPIATEVDGRTATLTPVVDRSAATPVAAPTSREERDMQALETLGTYVSVSVAIGGLVGTIIGAGIGCVAGLPAAGVGCLPGAVTGAGIGGVLGTIAVGGPTLIGAAINYFNTINSPFVPPKS